MTSQNEKPEQRLTRLFLSMWSADELRRLLRYNFPEDLANAMPGANASPAALAEAASQALLRRNDLAALWPCLIQDRPRRAHEIEAIRDAVHQQLHAPANAAALDDARPPKPATIGPIRVLFVLSCPKGQDQIDTAEEIRQIRAALVASPYRNRFTHEIITAATYTDLRVGLRQHKPHILHMACHGTPEAELVLSDGHGGEELIDAETFVELLDVLKEDLGLVLLNACHSTAITQKVAAVVDLVLGMRGAVADSSAVAFAAVFYESIAGGDTVEAGFRLGVNELRRRKANTSSPELLPVTGPQRQRRFARP